MLDGDRLTGLPLHHDPRRYIYIYERSIHISFGKFSKQRGWGNRRRMETPGNRLPVASELATNNWIRQIRELMSLCRCRYSLQMIGRRRAGIEVRKGPVTLKACRRSPPLAFSPFHFASLSTLPQNRLRGSTIAKAEGWAVPFFHMPKCCVGVGMSLVVVGRLCSESLEARHIAQA